MSSFVSCVVQGGVVKTLELTPRHFVPIALAKDQLARWSAFANIRAKDIALGDIMMAVGPDSTLSPHM